MKFLVNLLLTYQIVIVVTSYKLPESLQSLVCHKSEKNFAGCMLKVFDKTRTFIRKGIKEASIPPLDPLIVPLTTVDNSLNEFVSIKSTLKNVRIDGLSNGIYENVTADLDSLTGELFVTFPHLHMSCEYDVVGQLLSIPLESKGFFKGNFTNTKMYGKGAFKLVEENGEKHFVMDRFLNKARVGGGNIKLTAKNPNLQFAADLIDTFFNGNTRAVLDAVNPIYLQHQTVFFKDLINEVLAKFPAEQLLPE